MKQIGIFVASALNPKEVIAYFLGPSTGVPYTEGYMINPAAVATDYADNTKGKGILINRGNGKAQIIWFDTDANYAARGASAANPHWFAPDRNFLAVVLNGSGSTLIGDIDLTNSDLVFGGGETVSLTADTSKKMPFKKEGAKIVYDAALPGAVIAGTSITGLNGTSTSGTTTGGTTTTGTTTTGTTTGGTTTTGATTGNTGLSALPTWAWFLIVPVAVVLVVVAAKAIFKGMKGGKKSPKTVEK